MIHIMHHHTERALLFLTQMGPLSEAGGLDMTCLSSFETPTTEVRANKLLKKIVNCLSL